MKKFLSLVKLLFVQQYKARSSAVGNEKKASSKYSGSVCDTRFVLLADAFFNCGCHVLYGQDV